MALLKVKDENGNVYDIPLIKGEPGYTPQKGVDYVDGKDGEDGMSITVASVSESTEDGGENVVTFSDGNTLTVKNGRTPVKGTDYFTDDDIASVSSEVAKAVTLDGIGAAAEDHNHSATDINSGTFSVARGGTGKPTHTNNAVLTGNGASAVKNVSTASGALYATENNGAPKFGTLPIAQGGTGATTAAKALANLFALNIDHVTDNDFIVASGADLNNYTTPGVYKIISAAVAKTLVNCPYAAAGRLIVSAASATESVFQVVVFNAHNYHVWFRLQTADCVWGEWARIVMENNSYRKVKLWTNANLSNSFNAQTISLDLSGYDGVEIIFYADETTNVFQSTGFIPMRLRSALWYTTAISGHRLHREFTATDNGVAFITATNYSGNAAADKICIPYIIYGIKGIS